MRLVSVNTPRQNAEEIRQIAFSAGIDSVSFQTAERYSASGSTQSDVVVSIQTSTPAAKLFIEKILAADFFDPEATSIVVRQPRSVLSGVSLRDITVPLSEPGVDLLEELWQSSHITYGLVIRVLAGGGILGYGLMGQRLLLIIGGLLFLPVLPMLLAVAFGCATGQFKLALHGLRALIVSFFLLVLAGMAVAALTQPPIKFNEFPPFVASMLISSVVGIAAGLASIDDAGRRELIGLAAAAQIGIFPVWIGLCLVAGPPPLSGWPTVGTYALTLAGNTILLTTVAALVFIGSGVVKNIRLVHSE